MGDDSDRPQGAGFAREVPPRLRPRPRECRVVLEQGRADRQCRDPRSSLRSPGRVLPVMKRLALLSALLLLGTVACRRPIPSDARVTFDPEVVDGEPGTFRQTFNGPPGKLVLGTGWYGLESMDKSGGPWSGFSWAASASTVYFGMPESHDVELAARVVPFLYPGAPPQTVTPILNGAALEPVNLFRDWQELRVPLPAKL